MIELAAMTIIKYSCTRNYTVPLSEAPAKSSRRDRRFYDRLDRLDGVNVERAAAIGHGGFIVRSGSRGRS